MKQGVSLASRLGDGKDAVMMRGYWAVWMIVVVGLVWLWGGPSLEAASIPREPVLFADNFMRTAQERGGWTIASGEWALASAWDADPRGGGECFVNATYAQNPFAWVGHGGDTPGWCLAGQPTWDDYTLTVAVKPTAGGAVGIAVNMASPTSGLLVRWTPVNAPMPGGDTLSLLRVRSGKTTVLARQRGGYLPGQWYQVQAITTPAGEVRVLVDGRTRLKATGVTPRRGGIGLYVEGRDGASFDDVTAYGRMLRTDLIAEQQQARFNARFERDKGGMEGWASSQAEWGAYAGAPDGYRLHRWLFYGDAEVTATLQPGPDDRGQLCLLLNNDGASATTGYRALITRVDGGKTAYTLFRDAQALGTTTGDALHSGEDYTVRFLRVGNHLRLEIDGDAVLEATDRQPLAGNRIAYGATGAYDTVQTITAMGRGVKDYAFDNAPVDWVADGTWMPTTRWSCTPHWSFLGGWSRGDAVLWHKQRFTGDQALETFMALKMEYPRERQESPHRFRDFSVTICGDGHRPRSGYTGVYGAPGPDGTPNQRTVLLRDGVEVASVPQPALDYSGGAHTKWFELALYKHGATVEFWTLGERTLTFTDPHPLEGGVPGIGTSDNGIALGRARLAFANPPVPRTDPRVLLDEPWFPEWVDVGASYVVDFPGACSTTGTPVRLQASARDVPAGDEEAVTIAGRRATFTPRVAGEHWYQVTATDGTTASPAFNLAQRVFDPARGRDDTHAQVLYRFTEGRGRIVHDAGRAGAALDLAIPPDAPARWLPGGGLLLTGPCALTSAGAQKAAAAITRARACTLEFWVSLDTIFPPVDWVGTLFAWQRDNTHRNLAVAAMREHLLVTRTPTFTPRYGAMTIAPGLRTGLQHLVVTWDGATTTCYRNGQVIGQSTLPWQTKLWDNAAPLVLGNLPATPRCANDETCHFLGIAPYILREQHGTDYSFLGAYYLVALHDRCFTPADVQRHYEVGPSAK